MKIEYQFVFDETYYRDHLARAASQRPLFLRPILQGPLLFAMTVFGWFFLNSLGLESLAVAFAVLGAVAFLGVVVTPVSLRYGMLRHYKSSPEFGGETRVALTENGMDLSGMKSSGKADWEAITSGVRHADGIMLSQTGTTVWLPDAALTGSTPTEATEFVRSKVVVRDIS
ncbi:MAG: hypothetical protein QNJ14_00500 [Woeseiaceae bacterium]|nr:hypothetical protein [Woeseiaceae bacterium]